ncbi:MAG: toll/interleukin-1 receptor domain-containing protein [Gaiellaceae bacterium]
MAKIYISHRPGDAAGYVRALQEALASRHGREQVQTFADVARSDPGAPISRLIERAVDDADVVLAVIGTSWLSTTDEVGRTLVDADDRIRRELERALERDVALIPVPIGGASLPRREELPESLQPLLRKNAVEVTESAFGSGVDRLTRDIDTIAQRLEAARAPEPAPAAPAMPEPAARPATQVSTRPDLDWEAFQRLATLGRRGREDVSEGTKTLRNWFALLGMAAGAGAGYYALTRDDVGSAWLAAFIGLLVFNFVSRAFADVLNEPKKIRRLLYFALTPALASLSFYYTYQWWETWWLSFLLGFVFGGILNSTLGSVLFPSIHREESADTRSRWKLST